MVWLPSSYFPIRSYTQQAYCRTLSYWLFLTSIRLRTSGSVFTIYINNIRQIIFLQAFFKTK